MTQGVQESADRDGATTWSDVQHQQSDIVLALPVSEALALKSILQRLLQETDALGARNPESRDLKREAAATLGAFIGRLAEGLRPYDVPQETAS